MLAINAIYKTCRRDIANKPFPETMIFSRCGTEIQIDCFSGRDIPVVTWENVCMIVRGLLDYQENLPSGHYVDQLFRVHIGRFYLAIGKISDEATP